MNLIRTSVGDLKATQPDTHRKLYPFTQLAPSYERKKKKKKRAKTDSSRILLRVRGLKTEMIRE